VCQHCNTGLMVFVQTGAVRAPHAKVFRCNYCGFVELREPAKAAP
jgi:hypothetical protein